MLCECGVTYCYILVPFWCVWSGWQCFCFILLLFPAPPHFPAQFREWGKQKVILFLSMSIITQYTKRGQIHYPARKNMLGGGRGETGVLSMFLFSNQIIKLHTHTTCPLHHTILIFFNVEGGGEGSNLHSLYHIKVIFYFISILNLSHSISLCV